MTRKENTNGSYPHDRGGGIHLSNVSYNLISNVMVSNNGTNWYKGSTYLFNSRSW